MSETVRPVNVKLDGTAAAAVRARAEAEGGMTSISLSAAAEDLVIWGMKVRDQVNRGHLILDTDGLFREVGPLDEYKSDNGKLPGTPRGGSVMTEQFRQRSSVRRRNQRRR